MDRIRRMYDLIEWKGMKIPNKVCFKRGKKCTPDCPSYDLGWLYYDETE